LVEQALTKCPDSVVVSPLGLGYHPDHLIVANVAKRLQARGRRVIFYEDLPYAWRFTPDEVGVQARLLDGRLRPTMLDITAVYSQKRENLEEYASQLEPFAIQRTEEHASKLGRGRGRFERVWSLPGAGP
jgi:LmbE family N-acetylglucosaminyl deacetylase